MVVMVPGVVAAAVDIVNRIYRLSVHSFASLPVSPALLKPRLLLLYTGSTVERSLVCFKPRSNCSDRRHQKTGGESALVVVNLGRFYATFWRKKNIQLIIANTFSTKKSSRH